jgi:hypothetical protein
MGKRLSEVPLPDSQIIGRFNRQHKHENYKRFEKRQASFSLRSSGSEDDEHKIWE